MRLSAIRRNVRAWTSRAPLARGAAAVAAAILLLAGGACRDTSGPDTRVAAVSVTAPATAVEAGATLQLSAAALTRAGTPVAGKTFTWASGSGAATVGATGLVTAVSPGNVVITATETGSGTSGTFTLTVTPAAAASVTVSPESVQLDQGSTRTLAATVRDARGTVLAGRSVSWSSANPAVASVDGSGVVTAVAAGGPVAITATVEGRSASAQVTVAARIATRVLVTPRFLVVDATATAPLAAAAFDAAGTAIPDPRPTWTTTAAAVATVGADGSVRGVAAGLAGVAAQVNGAADTALVAVLGPSGLLATAFAGGQPKLAARAGQTVVVPVVLDLSRVSAAGDLGAAQFDLRYDPAVLVFQSAQAGVSGSVATHVPTPGVFKFSFAATEPQNTPRPTLVTLTFQVAAGAQPGAERAFSLTWTAPPASTGFAAYGIPLSAGGRVLVVAP
ncbi:Ig-like domain-containing protein [Longimicrobium sp.]|jgi:hypothetical protein|uniref:Ig-like domain-containing protein n=1 Tax=Longimicrobium sp. TaxID=2029185 RepID=UPI002F946008